MSRSSFSMRITKTQAVPNSSRRTTHLLQENMRCCVCVCDLWLTQAMKMPGPMPSEKGVALRVSSTWASWRECSDSNFLLLLFGAFQDLDITSHRCASLRIAAHLRAPSLPRLQVDVTKCGGMSCSGQGIRESRPTLCARAPAAHPEAVYKANPSCVLLASVSLHSLPRICAMHRGAPLQCHGHKASRSSRGLDWTLLDECYGGKEPPQSSTLILT